MSEQEKKIFILAFSLVIVSALFSSIIGCSGVHKQSLVKQGDQILLDYTCRFPGEKVIATTSKKIADDDALYPKSSAFVRSHEYHSHSLKAGAQIQTSQDDFIKGMENTIDDRLSQLIVGSEVGNEYRFEVDANIPANLKKEDRYLSMVRVRKRRKEFRFKKDVYLKSHEGKEPEVGQEVKVPVAGFLG